MERAALGRTRWASGKASGRSEGRAPQGSSHKELQSQTRTRQRPKSKARYSREPASRRLGRGAPGEAEHRRKGRGMGGRAADPAGPAPSTMPSAPLHPGAARPAPACAPHPLSRPVLTEAPRQPRARPPPRRFLPASPAAPRRGREVSGFSPPSPASLLPPAARGPPGPEQGRGTLRRSRSASRCSPALVAAPAGAPSPDARCPAPRPALLPHAPSSAASPPARPLFSPFLPTTSL